jgi:hypothetical protein
MKQHQINYEILHNTYGDCNEDLIELFQEFVNSHSSLLNSLEVSFASGNIDEYKECLHHNASPFTYVGFPGITELFRLHIKKCNNTLHISEMGTGHFNIIKSVKAAAGTLTTEINRLRINFNTEKRYMIAC